MDSVTSFIYGMSMMFFSMMAFLFYLTSSLDMMIIPFYSFVLMDLVCFLSGEPFMDAELFRY